MRFFILFSILFTQAALADTPFTYESMVGMIQQNRINSIETLLPQLPLSFRSRYNLVYASHSLQSATPVDPRAILYAQNGQLICAFNGAPEQTHFDDLECMEFLPQTRQFELHSIAFPSPRNGLTAPQFFTNTNLQHQNCLACHGNDPRPNWDTYPTWPGVYGSDDDVLTDQETAQIQPFLQSAANHPRYKYLVNLISPTDASIRTHNADFTELEENLNFHRIARILESAPTYAQFKFAELGALVCFAPQFKEFFPTSQQIPPLSDFTTPLDNKGSENAFFWVMQIQNITGIQANRLSMKFLPNLTNPQFPGPFTTPGFAGQEIAYVLAQDDSELRTFVKAMPEGARDGNIFNRAQATNCLALAHASLAALSH